MPLIGDIRRLGGLQANINRLAQIPARASRAVSDRINDRLQEGYDRGTDPYGRPWAPLQASTLAKGRHPPPLTASGDMRRGTIAKPLQRGGVGLLLPFPGQIHMGGSVRNLPARPPLPRGPVPAAWKADIESSVRDAFRKGGR